MHYFYLKYQAICSLNKLPIWWCVCSRLIPGHLRYGWCVWRYLLVCWVRVRGETCLDKAYFKSIIQSLNPNQSPATKAYTVSLHLCQGPISFPMSELKREAGQRYCRLILQLWLGWGHWARSTSQVSPYSMRPLFSSPLWAPLYTNGLFNNAASYTLDWSPQRQTAVFRD